MLKNTILTLLRVLGKQALLTILEFIVDLLNRKHNVSEIDISKTIKTTVNNASK